MDAGQLPECFCWTRFGTEAGQAVGHILQRKERERTANDGIFIWGIGNAVGPSIRELLRRTPRPEVLFSPIRSSPKQHDVEPPAVAAWVLAETFDGDLYRMPKHSLVTSRYDPLAPSDMHYALVCFSPRPLTELEPVAKLPFNSLKNLRTGRPVGASQVTAVVTREDTELGDRVQMYDVAIRAELVYPYLVKLRQPILLPQPDCAEAADDAWSQLAFRHLQERETSEVINGVGPLQMVMPFETAGAQVLERRPCSDWYAQMRVLYPEED